MTGLIVSKAQTLVLSLSMDLLGMIESYSDKLENIIALNWKCSSYIPVIMVNHIYLGDLPKNMLEFVILKILKILGGGVLSTILLPSSA